MAEVAPAGWSGALQVLADALPSGSPSVVVIDAGPYLMDRVEGFEGLRDSPTIRSPLAAVSRSGIDSPAVDARYGPDDLIRAWHSGS
jgi:hypothetical protein